MDSIADCAVIAISRRREKFIIYEKNVLKHNLTMRNQKISWFGIYMNMNESLGFLGDGQYLIMNSEFKLDSKMTGFEVISAGSGRIEIKVKNRFSE